MLYDAWGEDTMLLQIREFIAREHTVSTTQVARYFQMDEYAVLPILEILIRKKIIRAAVQSKYCHNTCQNCLSNTPKYYQYSL